MLGVGVAPTRANAFAREPFEITVLSSRSDMITGPEALVRIDVPASATLEKVRVRLNGNDVTEQLRAEDHALAGVLRGLKVGANTVMASRDGMFSSRDTSVVLHAYPDIGPVFSGQHEQPFVCETSAFVMPDGSALGPALDDACRVASRVDYYYRTATNPAWLPLGDALPSDVMRVRTSIGAVVPYVVRVETGTVNRAIYQVALLHDPTRGEPVDAFHRSPGWNGRLVYTFGGGCAAGWYRQGNTTGGVMDDPILRQGYAMASASLNVFGNNCNEVTAAETMMMVKERFIEAYGPPKHTIGWGCSGGSYQQHQIADDYPGLLDGIIPGCSFPEVGFATVQFISDARLLDNYFTKVAPGSFTPDEQRAVAGFQTLATMANVAIGAGRISPTEVCPEVLPVALRYDAAKNPTGARCDVYSHAVNVYGRDSTTGFARRPLDNVGIQYGLAALNHGLISAEQFLALNAGIGGYDDDAHIVSRRTSGDLEAIDIAYRTGRLTHGGLGLRTTPIIDYRAYMDDAPEGDIHLRYHSFAMRERLQAANGTSGNQVMLVEDGRYGLYSSASPMLLGALGHMDAWLDNIANDRGKDTGLRKVIRNKPRELREGCNTRDASPAFISEALVRESGMCAALYPAPGAPREVAGASVRSDVIKCRLKRIDINDYAVPFDDEERRRLEHIFPSGVCDWSARGAKQRPPAGTWQRF